MWGGEVACGPARRPSLCVCLFSGCPSKAFLGHGGTPANASSFSSQAGGNNSQKAWERVGQLRLLGENQAQGLSVVFCGYLCAPAISYLPFPHPIPLPGSHQVHPLDLECLGKFPVQTAGLSRATPFQMESSQKSGRWDFDLGFFFQAFVQINPLGNYMYFVLKEMICLLLVF
jgi:hypothetical protein